MNTDGPITFTGLIKFLQYIKGPDHWHEVGATGEPAYEDSWAHYDATKPARFIKDVGGVVHLQGLVKAGSTGGAATIFTLPAGYRPRDITLATASNNVFGYLNITSAGAVVPQVGNNTWFSINCSFWVG